MHTPWMHSSEPGCSTIQLGNITPIHLLPIVAENSYTAAEFGCIDIWCCRYRNIQDQKLLKHYLSLLSPSERDRYGRFRSTASRREFLVTRALARWALSKYATVKPEEIFFSIDAYGKPRVKHPPVAHDLSFSIGHTSGICVFAVAPYLTDLGIDIERIDINCDYVKLAESVFSSAETAALSALHRDLRRIPFFASWTLKESYVKARGLGLAIPLDKVTFIVKPNRDIYVTLDPELRDDPRHWSFALLRIGKCYLIAVCMNKRSSKTILRYTFCVPFAERLDQRRLVD